MRTRHVLVSGGSRGIGRAVARHMIRTGETVTVTGRDAATLQEVVQAGDAHHYVVCDVTDDHAVVTACKKAVSQAGPVDVLVNNAGGSSSGRFGTMAVRDFVDAFQLNVLGAVRLCQSVLPGMVERGKGRIVNVASTAALRGYEYVAPYVTAKHALLGLTRSLALEYARSGITVNAVCPGFTDSDLVSASIARAAGKSGRPAEDIRAEFARFNPRGCLNTTEEVAIAVAFLCSIGASAVNGVALPVAGGEVG
ncbi:NAD(P)-dependent oxidoreductase [Komagataeibacter xylinus]|uniref:NAD(P)-dependent oxidoreductase n=1 Tax=Komagataeibacter xylinus TaxID=28448 RepID=A0A318PT57_KOMXY|nr:SDR family oxidoreductase [Komagataeibacter xylinus]AZV39837.1 NAD(P)-dependent oxidoreductase [Komagataeibacter xylinus]PYD56741.1 NAD(P)-dependent oxidoreductase [Komagataeibacter xylinus]